MSHQQIYDTERIRKISQIMPEFSNVARPGDEVYMGLEGDPCFPYLDCKRPVGVVQHVDSSNADETIVTLNIDNVQKKVSSLSLSPRDVWEFTDKSFRGVLQRNAPNEPASASPPPYRGGADHKSVQALQADIDAIASKLTAQNENTRAFQNTLITSLSAMADDIVALGGKKASFSNTLSTAYRAMESGAPGDDAHSDVSSADSDN